MWKFHNSASAKAERRESRVQNQTGGRKVLIWIERALLVSGLALIGFYRAARIESSFSSRAALKKFAALELRADARGASGGKDDELKSSEPMDLPRADFSRWSERRVKAYQQRQEPGVPLAVLQIPKIRLNVPLFEGTDDVTLNHAVGRIGGTSRPGEPGNIGIAGHRDGFFRGLKDVSVGDAIDLRTLERTDTYIVNGMKIVAPNQVEVLRPTSVPSLTLVTCYPFYFLGSAPQRYIVTASLSSEINGKVEDSNSGRRQQQIIQSGETYENVWQEGSFVQQKRRRNRSGFGRTGHGLGARLNRHNHPTWTLVVRHRGEER